MNILLISQCNKRALETSRKILDQFAERKGDRCWQTAITMAGVVTLRQLLRKTARRNTAVACHWIKSSGQTELMWIVGNPRRFSASGTVPTNRTGRDILRTQDENSWNSSEALALIAGIAGLFHDFGKANALFQMGLKKDSQRHFQPYRHEWVSLRLFQAFVQGRSDPQWLAALAQVSANDEAALLQSLYGDKPGHSDSPFAALSGSPLAQVIGWLIVAHHRLPVYPASGNGSLYQAEPAIPDRANWLEQQFNTLWNSVNQDRDGWSERDFEQVWHFPWGTPLQSSRWCAKAQKLAKRAQQCGTLVTFGRMDQLFTLHLARLVLMLSDHVYSAGPAVAGWQGDDYLAWANTDRQTKAYKQRLDEHNIGVGQNSLLLGRLLPHIRDSLPAITRHKDFKRRSPNAHFRWQDKAFDLTATLRLSACRQGFFGVNMASTGWGKTLANARIMYALADEQRGCRFSVALGLRTLTLQTGDALRDRLHLQDDDLAVMIGSSAVQKLHQPEMPDTSSLSAEALFADHQYVRYDGMLDDGRLSHWLRQDSRLHKLVSAPILVSTIDFLMPATEGTRGGKQIAPMLRLLTSDLVLDEPDDFDINDQPALCRLVNWAGMLGSRVLLSSATLPPAQVRALFDAYRAGRREYQRACAEPGNVPTISCAWFDECGAVSGLIPSSLSFSEQHQQFVARRVRYLTQQTAQAPLRHVALLPVEPADCQPEVVFPCVAEVLQRAMIDLHQYHHQPHPAGKRVSLGVIRMANIDPLVAVSQQLMQLSVPADHRIHYCVYHSQHPLAMRSYIEQQLDAVLDRHHPDALWSNSRIRQALNDYSETNHLFVVLASPVVEVGRDWDLDWAIAEPSSMRSLIQLAGRVRRHRYQPERSLIRVPNMRLLTKNIKALRESNREKPAYCRPGFESQDGMLLSHDLSDILLPEQYQYPDSVPCISNNNPVSIDPSANLVSLEHYQLAKRLFGTAKTPVCAAVWWRGAKDKQGNKIQPDYPISWNAEMQRRFPFRQSAPEECYYLFPDEDNEQLPVLKMPDNGASGYKTASVNYPVLLQSAGNSCWMAISYSELYTQLADRFALEFADVCRIFGEISLRRLSENSIAPWSFHPLLGIFRPLS